MVYDDVTLTHQRVWGTTEGYYFKNGQSLGDFPTSSGSYVSVLALSIDGPPGVYTVAFNCKVESQVGATFSLGIQFSAGAIRSTEYSIPVSGSDGPFPVSATWTVTKGAPIMVCEIEAKSSNGLNVVHVLDSEITVQGLHDPTP
jgi:hypothetical protein